jgi:hypothetical protein
MKLFRSSSVSLSVSLSIFAVFAAVACGSSSSSSGSGATGGKDAGSKVPSLSGGKPSGQGKKGGTGSTQPTAGSGAAGSRTTSSDLKKPAPMSGDNPCTGVPDGRAVCGSDTALYFCAGSQLYQIDCNALMTSPDYGFGAGACYQTDAVTDCFGCGATADGSNACCAGVADGLLCCDDSSQCVTVTAP